jgi:hypothetical protein
VVTSAKAKFFPAKSIAPVATTTATTTGFIASTGIGTLLGGPALTANVYGSNAFTESDTYKLLTLSLVLAAAGLFLTNSNAFSRTYKVMADAIIIGQGPRASRSRA